MSSDYVMKRVSIGSANENTYAPGFAVHEGDIVLDKGCHFVVLPGKLDRSKPISRKKVTNGPARTSDRLLRVKERNEDSAVIAILHQNSYFTSSNFSINSHMGHHSHQLSILQDRTPAHE